MQYNENMEALAKKVSRIAGKITLVLALVIGALCGHFTLRFLINGSVMNALATILLCAIGLWAIHKFVWWLTITIALIRIKINRTNQ